jgi:tetratricopeptide (TPR) repeat protein
MKKYFLFLLVCTLFAVLSFTSLANDTLAQADALFDKGDVGSMFESIPLYIMAVEANPDSYEANWKCARVHREYAILSLEGELEGWKEICKKYGKDGMEYGEKAKEMEPDKIEGYYYYGLCVASYSDGISVVKALKEGLKGSTQKAFYKAYELDKMFVDGGPMLAIARFWHQLPFPLTNKRRAEKYFKEHHEYFPDDPQGLVYYAELLIDRRKKDEAKPLLEKAIVGDEPYYSKWAKEMLEDL